MLTVAGRQPWVDAADRRPLPGRRVIVRCLDPDATANESRSHVAITVYRPGSSNDWPYLAPHWAGRVTHWMHIPDGPWE